MDRGRAWDTLCEFTKTEGLRKHGLAVEAVMRYFARKYGEDEERWALVGLLHDYDYEQFPDDHPQGGQAVLRERGLPEDLLYAIVTHGEHVGLPRKSILDKTLFAVDELTGFITAVALVKPNKSLFEVDVPSVRKKLKDKAFARSVRREDIIKGAEELGVPLDELIEETIKGIQTAADELGLRGGAH
jgi:putative nucleotidyltransferase with HDIG domain